MLPVVEMGKIGACAVVVGASVGGLLAARGLADACEQVTVTDRDSLRPHAQSRVVCPGTALSRAAAQWRWDP